jgi:type IV secretory pathway VirB2 component (pilin)
VIRVKSKVADIVARHDALCTFRPSRAYIFARRFSMPTLGRALRAPRFCNATVFWIAVQLVLMAMTAVPAYAQSPWENAVEALRVSFTGPIARGLSLVAIVVSGLMWAYGEESKRMIAGIVFGVAMALGSVQFMSWLFP